MILFFILFIILFIIFCINLHNFNDLKNYFNSNNVIVFGKKGTGKDIIFNSITNKRKKYYSNVPYTNSNYELITPNQLKLGTNTFEKLLNDCIEKVNWNFQENVDVFISDCGIYLPSQYDSILHRKYGGLPLVYALSRHIGNFNIHCNAQALDRIWKVLREQADIYIKTLKTIKMPFFLVVKYRVYDKYSSALNDIRPLKKKLLESDTAAVQNANVGFIKESFIIVTKRKTRYNSRYFRTLFIEEESKS